MSYTPINWQSGDTITAEKLNKMDNGWGIQPAPLFSETVTTADDEYGNYGSTLSYTGTDKPDSLTITFDGVDYNCAIQTKGSNNYYYGASSPTDFTVYPFLVGRIGGEWWLYTQTAGTHTISASVEALQTSDDFKAAVNSTIDFGTVPLLLKDGETTITEVSTAIEQGRLVYFSGKVNFHPKAFILVVPSIDCTIYPNDLGITAHFGRDDGLFYITSST